MAVCCHHGLVHFLMECWPTGVLGIEWRYDGQTAKEVLLCDGAACMNRGLDNRLVDVSGDGQLMDTWGGEQTDETEVGF